MINITVKKRNGSYLDFLSKGHAGYAEEGQDIVCAAVSALIITTVNSLEKFTDEQIAIYQDQINEAYEEFVNIVADGRDMSVEDVKKLADGRTYTAKQAKNNGLIDEISLYPDMKDAMSKKLGTSTFYEMESDEGLLQSLFSKAESLVPKSEAQVLTETAKSVESGVPMYYAEQLR